MTSPQELKEGELFHLSNFDWIFSLMDVDKAKRAITFMSLFSLLQ
jgi:hypothetical protein